MPKTGGLSVKLTKRKDSVREIGRKNAKVISPVLRMSELAFVTSRISKYAN